MRNTVLAFAILPTIAMLSACGQKFPDADKLKTDIDQSFASARPGAHYEISKLEKLTCKAIENTGGVGCSFDLTVTDTDVQVTRTGQEWFEYAADESVAKKPDYPWEFEILNAVGKALQTNPEFAEIKTEQVETNCDPNDKKPGYFCLVSLKVIDGTAKPIGASFSSDLVYSDGHWTLTPWPAALTGGWQGAALSLYIGKVSMELQAEGGETTEFDMKLADAHTVQFRRQAEGTLSGTVTKAAGPTFSCNYVYSVLKLALSNCRYPELNATFYKNRD